MGFSLAESERHSILSGEIDFGQVQSAWIELQEGKDVMIQILEKKWYECF